MGHYIPLTWMTLGLDYLLWGMDPTGYHLTNVLLHTANALLVYLIALRPLTLTLSSSRIEPWGLRIGAGFAPLLFGPEVAIEHFRRAPAVDPGFTEAQRNLYRVLRAQGLSSSSR